MTYRPDNPLIVQGDKTVLLEVDNPAYAPARDLLARFAELEKSPEYIHSYKISPLSLWNAAASGMDGTTILAGLELYSKYPIPSNVRVDIIEAIDRYGRIQLIRADGNLHLVSDDPLLITEISRHKKILPYIEAILDTKTLRVNAAMRGHLKHALVQIGYPVADLAGYLEGATLPLHLRSITVSGETFTVRAYQADAASAFYAAGSEQGGSGVVVLPCGAGKTIVGMAAMAQTQTNTLILTPNSVGVDQWIRELTEKTSLTADEVGMYTGERKEIRPVTIATYQTLTYRKRGAKSGSLYDDFPHFHIFNERDWGLIIYDEVHLLPAPVFSITAELQARRRLGLTATLVREDGREEDVFALIGPKKYDLPWKELEQQGWIATADVTEVRLPMPDDLRMDYALAEDNKIKYRIAACNPHKLNVLDEILAKHPDEPTLIIGMYLEQLDHIQKRYGFPLITGETPTLQRRKWYEKFRDGECRNLIISKVGNFALDLPDAAVMVQLSGTFGSRQEEAQRLGRILRPKSDGQLAHFYTLVTKDTIDQQYGANRQLFLTEQGYAYTILYADEIEQYEPRRTAQ